MSASGGEADAQARGRRSRLVTRIDRLASTNLRNRGSSRSRGFRHPRSSAPHTTFGRGVRRQCLG